MIDRRVFLRLAAMTTVVAAKASMPFAVEDEAAGWLPCDGSEIPRDGFGELFARLGTVYGRPSRRDYFRLPNFDKIAAPDAPVLRHIIKARFDKNDAYPIGTVLLAV